MATTTRPADTITSSYAPASRELRNCCCIGSTRSSRRSADVDLDYLWIWPYDQGGCTCSRLQALGRQWLPAHGRADLAALQAGLSRGPGDPVQLVLSTTLRMASGKGWIAPSVFAPIGSITCSQMTMAIVSRPIPWSMGRPGGLPMVDFPEISMYSASPWGGFGANPFPDHLQALWAERRVRPGRRLSLFRGDLRGYQQGHLRPVLLATGQAGLGHGARVYSFRVRGERRGADRTRCRHPGAQPATASAG